MGKRYSAEHSKPKKPFLQRWLPWKGDSAKDVILKILILLMLAVFLVSSGYLINHLIILPRQTDQIMEEIQQIYYDIPEISESSRPEESSKPDASSKTEEASKPNREESPPKPELTDEQVRAQIKRLQKINPDILGWVRIPNTVIDYPVLQSSEKDPEYYLHRDYNEGYSPYGSIFLQSGTAIDGSDRNLLLYGHSMNDGRMFASLLRFGQLDVYKKSPVITFNTAESGGKWKIISVFKTNTDKKQGKLFSYTRRHFSSDSSYLNFIYQLRQRSIINTGVDFNENDSIISLSTCSYEFEGFRTVVVARKVRDGESSKVDTSKASYNSKTVYPRCWYDRYGGSAPKWPKTFEEALEQGKIDWYKP